MTRYPARGGPDDVNGAATLAMLEAEWDNLASLLSVAVGAATAGVLALTGVAVPAVAVRRAVARLADRVSLCAVGLAVMSIAVNLIVTWHDGVPLPLYHDEFSYLLAADTFAHGRLTNPTPPLWQHFETPHQLMVPTYMSKYPPGQGLVLAIGQALVGRPVAGAWLSTAAAVVAIYWMLLAFARPPWALLGGAVAALHPQLLEWGQCYWGGSVAVLGGAVLLGGWGRLMVGPSRRASVAIGVGLAVLANSRPYEGLVLAAPLLLVLAGRHRRAAVAAFAPAALVLLPVVVAMGWYDYRVTGHALRLPFVEYAAQYDVYPKFWFLPARPPPVYRNRTMAFVHGDFERGLYDRLRTLRGFWPIALFRLGELFDTGTKLVVLLIPVAAACVDRADRRRLGWVWTAIGVFAVGLWAETFVLPHYEAPALPAILLLAVVGWQRLAGGAARRGRAVAAATVAGFLAGAALSVARPVFRSDLLDGQRELQAVLPQLAHGRQLVFVRYAPLRSPHVEYVHNGADLDQSRIVWARAADPATDRPLARRFGDRRSWLLDVQGKLTLSPYPPPAER